jgi:uncharacterized membrane protein
MTTPPSTGMGKGRIEALADGVFAIAMTLLILDVKVPPRGEEPMDDLARQLWALWPRFAAYGVTFIIVGVFWVGHHAQLNFVRRADRPFMWLNVLFLLFISALPFSTGLLGQHHDNPVAIAFYCGNLILAGVVLYIQLLYAAGPGRLFDPDLDPRFIRAGGYRILMGPMIYALAIPVAFVSPAASLALCALAPVLYLIPGRVDAYWKGQRRE